MSAAHGIARASIVFDVAAVLCRCGVRVHGRGAAALAAYREHRALTTSRAARRAATSAPVRVLPFTAR